MMDTQQLNSELAPKFDDSHDIQPAFHTMKRMSQEQSNIYMSTIPLSFGKERSFGGFRDIE